MAKKSNSNNKKNIIIGVCAAIVIIVLIVLAIIFATRDGGIGGLNDSYFVSDGTKYVLNVDANNMVFDDAEKQPVKAHLVYFYSGDTVTGLKAYYEYADDNEAKEAYEYYKNASDNYKNISQDGKFVILEAKESEYEGITASDVKQQIEFMEMLNKTNNAETGETTNEQPAEDAANEQPAEQSSETNEGQE